MLTDRIFVFLNCYGPDIEAGALRSFLCFTWAFNHLILISPIRLPLLGAIKKLVLSIILLFHVLLVF